MTEQVGYDPVTETFTVMGMKVSLAFFAMLRDLPIGAKIEIVARPDGQPIQLRNHMPSIDPTGWPLRDSP